MTPADVYRQQWARRRRGWRSKRYGVVALELTGRRAPATLGALALAATVAALALPGWAARVRPWDLGDRGATAVYLALGAVALLVLRTAAPGAVRDAGGYVDTFRTFIAPPYDKAQHFALSLTLVVLAALALGVPTGAAFGVTLIFGGLWEWAGAAGGGYASTRDVAADALGCAWGALALLAGGAPL